MKAPKRPDTRRETADGRIVRRAGPMIASAIFVLALLVAGMLAILDIGGTAADVGGLLAIVAALVAFSRAAVRLAEGGPAVREREPGAGRLR